MFAYVIKCQMFTRRLRSGFRLVGQLLIRQILTLFSGYTRNIALNKKRMALASSGHTIFCLGQYFSVQPSKRVNIMYVWMEKVVNVLLINSHATNLYQHNRVVTTSAPVDFVKWIVVSRNHSNHIIFIHLLTSQRAHCIDVRYPSSLRVRMQIFIINVYSTSKQLN